MTKKHIAKTGIAAGQWVTCTAEQACRNGGKHVDQATLMQAQAWLGYQKVNKKASELTENEVALFEISGFDGSPEAITRLRKSVAPRTTSNFNQVRSTEEDWNNVKDLAKELGAEVRGVKIYDTATGQLIGVKEVEIEGVQYDVMRLNQLIDTNSQKTVTVNA